MVMSIHKRVLEKNLELGKHIYTCCSNSLDWYSTTVTELS
jgi:hypothetical protein